MKLETIDYIVLYWRTAVCICKFMPARFANDLWVANGHDVFTFTCVCQFQPCLRLASASGLKQLETVEGF